MLVLRMVPLLLSGLLIEAAAMQETGMNIELNVDHLDRLTRSNMRVAAKQASVDNDPCKPIFHIMPKAGGCGDPNGPIYFNGKYHMFYQHTPEFEWSTPVEEWEEWQGSYNHTGWGHVSSTDLVYWEHEPIALMPQPGSYDSNYCASGSTVIDDDGIPTIFYTAAEPQTQCIARSHDPNLRWWLKDANNPIILEPDIPGFRKGGFRDPFLWREGTTWHMLLSGALYEVGGMSVHYQSENLTDWKYIGAFAKGMGEHCIAWECPNFIRFGNMGMLIVSPLFDNLQETNHAPRGSVVYTIAPYPGNGDFTPGEWKSIDIGGPNNFYATQCLQTPDGRWLLWGMNLGGGNWNHHWTINLSLPRVITLRPDGLLGQEPPEELQKLRRSHWGEKNQVIDSDYLLKTKSNTCEIIVEFELGSAKVVGLDLRASDDFTSKIRIAFDVEKSLLHINEHHIPFELLEGENCLRLHTFVDNSVVEVFINRRECGTVQQFHNIEDNAIRLFSEGGTAHIRTVDVWEMGSIWEKHSSNHL